MSEDTCREGQRGQWPWRLLRRHHPRKRMIQYAAPCRLYLTVSEYWMPACAGMTTVW